ncbi:synaptotagmin-1-like [Convolutriloba macropyga]|uniref:synaptotagmin-1-like n=1 Tax=Convolutriloba macropyga TaxID=536237 RepID=UPI003F526CB0
MPYPYLRHQPGKMRRNKRDTSNTTSDVTIGDEEGNLMSQQGPALVREEVEVVAEENPIGGAGKTPQLDVSKSETEVKRNPNGYQDSMSPVVTGLVVFLCVLGLVATAYVCARRAMRKNKKIGGLGAGGVGGKKGEKRGLKSGPEMRAVQELGNAYKEKLIEDVEAENENFLDQSNLSSSSSNRKVHLGRLHFSIDYNFSENQVSLVLVLFMFLTLFSRRLIDSGRIVTASDFIKYFNGNLVVETSFIDMLLVTLSIIGLTG